MRLGGRSRRGNELTEGCEGAGRVDGTGAAIHQHGHAQRLGDLGLGGTGVRGALRV